MNSIPLTLRKAAAISATTALLMLSFGSTIHATGSDVTITAASTGTQVLAANGSSTVMATFSPALNLASAVLTAHATSSTSAYYGVRVQSATSSSDVHWEITVHHATAALASGDVDIKEVGTFNDTRGKVRDALYSTTVTSGDLKLSGIAGWDVSAGDDFTNVDKITFASSSPSGLYTITRTLVDTGSGMAFSSPFSFTLNLSAAATSTGGGGTGTSTPPTGTSTPPTGTSTPPTGTSTPPTSTTTLPVITLTGSSTIYITNCDRQGVFTEPGFSAVDSLGATTTATSTGIVDMTQSGTYTLTYTAHDANGTSTATRFVNVDTCLGGSSGGGGLIFGSQAINPSGFSNTNFGFTPALVPGIVTGPEFFFPGIPATGGSFMFTTDLTVGSRGDDVAELQGRLTEIDYFRGPITGYFGPLTRAAVMKLQKNNDLIVTGRLDAATRALLNS